MAKALVTGGGVVVSKVESLSAQKWSRPDDFAVDGSPPGADSVHHRLVWLRGNGHVHVRAGARNFTMQPTGAVWVSSMAALEIHGQGSVGAALFVSSTCPPTWAQTVHLGIDPAITALLEWLPAQWDEEWAPAVASAVTRQIALAHAGRPVSMPVPTDPRIRRVVVAFLNDPSDLRDVAAWGEYAGYSIRTFRRRFAAATGRSFSAWRSEVRIRTAVSMLAAGWTVDNVASRCGYRSTTAFARAFKEATSLPPSLVVETEPQIVNELRDAWPNLRDLVDEGGQVIRTSPDNRAFPTRAAALAASGLLLLSAACGADEGGADASPSSARASAVDPEAAAGEAVAASTTTAAPAVPNPTRESNPDAAAAVENADSAGAHEREPSESVGAESASFPVTVEHVIGTTTLDAPPDRILAVSAGTELASLLALGVQPVAYGGSGIPIEVPWLEEAGATDPGIEIFPFPTEVNLELLATFEPDLILSVRGLVNENNLDTVEEIAPTIVVGRTDWRGGLLAVGEAIGRLGEATTKVEAIEASFDDLTERAPFAAGRSIDIVTVRGDEVYQYTAVDNLFNELLVAGGLQPLPEPNGGDFPDINQLSAEEVGELDAEGIVVIDPIGSTAAELEQNPLWSTLPAVQAGRVAAVTGADALAMFSTNALTIPVQLDVLEAALTEFFAE
ncbi:MAG: helix-turn-helix domain-containing protein [Actinomycetota bacterium]